MRAVNPRWKVRVQAQWKRWYPRRKELHFWWQVGAQVKARRVRHDDRKTITQICMEVDKHVPVSKTGY